MIQSSENENCDKKLLQNDAGPSQNKSYDRYKTHSPDEYAKNMVKKLRAIPKHTNNDKKKTLNVRDQPHVEKFPHETHNTKNKTREENECQNQCFCNQKYIWDSDEKNIIDLGSLKICNHCKKQHEFCLNYNPKNSLHHGQR